jgi:hypothetical protein
VGFVVIVLNFINRDPNITVFLEDPAKSNYPSPDTAAQFEPSLCFVHNETLPESRVRRTSDWMTIDRFGYENNFSIPSIQLL